MIQGRPAFDGLAVMEIELDFLHPPVNVTAKAAFISSVSGLTHGHTTAYGTFSWSDVVREKANELRTAIENDLAKRHLQEIEEGSATPSLGLGIAENLQDEDGKSQI